MIEILHVFYIVNNKLKKIIRLGIKSYFSHTATHGYFYMDLFIFVSKINSILI